PAYFAEYQKMTPYTPEVTDYKQTTLALLQRPTIASKEWVYSQFDSEARGNTVVAPGSSAGIIRVAGTNKGLAMTSDCNSRFVYLDPETGGKIAVAEAARNLICSGAEPIALTDCLNFGSPDKPEVFWQLEQSADGISAACVALDTPVIGGNVSLSNEVNGQPVKPTPTIGMVGLVSDLAHTTSSTATAAGASVYVIGETKPEFGGSEIQQMLTGTVSGRVPTIDLSIESRRQQQLLEAIQQGFVQSATDPSEGGLVVALLEMVFGEQQLGLDITLEGDAVTALFSESQSRFVVTVDPANEAAFEALVTDAKKVGVTTTGDVTIRGEQQVWIEGHVAEFYEAWKGALRCLLN
ncbi:MAG TPA: AIR synthase related protein, partial [Savagea sp.]